MEKWMITTPLFENDFREKSKSYTLGNMKVGSFCFNDLKVERFSYLNVLNVDFSGCFTENFRSSKEVSKKLNKKSNKSVL